MAEADRDQPSPHSRARQATLGLLLAAVALTCSALGVWQVQRRAWKNDLIARVEARLSQPPATLPAAATWTALGKDDEYRRLTASGRFLHDKEVLVTASTERGPGYWVLTPLAQADGTAVFINRGFVTSDYRDPASRPLSLTAGDTTVTGLLRLSEAESWILRQNDPAQNRWYRRTPDQFGAARGLDGVAPFFIDADATPNAGGWPVGGLTQVRFPNNHLMYAITWFALAAMAVWGVVYVLRTGRQESDQD